VFCKLYGYLISMMIISKQPWFEFYWLTAHSNIDRLFAMWQAMNPNNYINQPAKARFSTFATAAGSSEDVNSSLKPFRLQAGFWTSTVVSETESLGYAYPETERWNFLTTQLYQRSIRETVGRLYFEIPAIRI
jgi:tyrosinase